MNEVYSRSRRVGIRRVLLVAVLQAYLVMESPWVCRGQTTAASGATALSSGSAAQITTSGTYYLTQDVLVSGGISNGIEITASNVTLDLNGHKITTNTTASGQTGPTVSTYGIYALNCNNLTIRGGTVSGFLCGVFFDASVNGQRSYDGSTSSGHLLENLTVLNNLAQGICVVGGGTIIRQCQVTNTGGSTLAGWTNSYGIACYGPDDRVLDCVVSNVSAPAFAYGVYFGTGATNAFAVLNRINGVDYGIYYDGGSAGKYERNLVGYGAYRGYWGGSGGVDAGHNIVDSNVDGVDDDWEMTYFGTLSVNLSAPAVGSTGPTVLQEYQLGLNSSVASPTGLTVTLAGTQAVLTWSESTAGANLFSVQYSTDGGKNWYATTNLSNLAFSGANSSVTVTGLTLGLDYSFCITTAGQSGYSAPSAPDAVPSIMLTTPSGAILVP